MFAFELLFLFGFPLLLACGAAYLTWRALSRPVVFLTVATTVLYFVYAASIWLLAPGPFGFIVSVPQPGEAPASEPLFLLLPPYKMPLIAFAAAAIPVLALLLRVFKKGART
jgi:hypothetical protein